jgi:hypothetical protein
MIHRDFRDADGGFIDEQWQESVPTVEGRNAGQRRSSKDAERASDVLEIDSEHGTARGARDPRGEAAEPVILAMSSNAADEIGVGETFNQTREIGWIVLTVPIHGGDYVAFGVAKAGPDRGALAGPGRVAETVDARIKVPGLMDEAPSAIGAGVVYEDQFEFECLLFQGVGHLFGKGQDVILLVMDGHDDRQEDRHGWEVNIALVLAPAL